MLLQLSFNMKYFISKMVVYEVLQ
uniref:Uncharacterized protein n=1 Tax=Rhizophora mucronata TaxID=61149 RepID=A0A2P2JED4_RHIMU